VISTEAVARPGVPGDGGTAPPGQSANPVAVLRNRSFLLLWLSQVATQVGGNMVTYGLTVLVFEVTGSSSAVSILLLTFLVPAVLVSAVAGVFVDRVDRRHMLVVTNLLRAVAFGVMVLFDTNVMAIYALNIFVSVVTTFFAPTELAMIPRLVKKEQLVAATSIFTLTTNAAFALGFALLGPLVVTVAGPTVLIIVVAAFYLVAAGFCFVLPSDAKLAVREQGEAPTRADEVAAAERRTEDSLPEIPGLAAQAGAAAAGEAAAAAAAADGRSTMAQVREALGTTYVQLREGIAYIRANPPVRWSLAYLGISASLIGVLGALGPDFATSNLGLAPKDFVVVVLPLGAGVVTGVLFVGSYGRLFPRRRLIEAGLISLGVLLLGLALAGPIAAAITRLQAQTNIAPNLNVSLLAIVVVIAFLAGVAYAVIAIPSQTQLQEDIHEEVRGRVFGVLNMLLSVASFVPIIIVGPITDVVGSTVVILTCGLLIGLSGLASVVMRRTPPAPPDSPPATVAPGQPPGVP
jgi:MFS family permease